MADIIHMPKLGFDMKEGTLVRWVKMEGESVNKGDVIAEIETDKATVEVESSFSGVLLKHFVEVDAIVPIGDPIAAVGAEGEEVTGSEVDDRAGAPQEVPTADKQAETKSAAAETSAKTEVAEQPADGDDRLKASPLARKLAGELQMNLQDIAGSGPGGRIVKKDVESFAQKTESAKAAGVMKHAAAQAQAEPQQSGVSLPAPTWVAGEVKAEDKRVPTSKLRQAIARRMTESKQQVPHFYATYEFDVEELMFLRNKVNVTLPDEQKLSVNDFIVKAVAVTLKRFPNLNASLDGAEIVQRGAVNIGVAVAVEGGLLTVVVQNADLKPIRLISAEVKEMAGRVRSGKIKAEDIEGSTFSISNLGMFGVDHFSAIINPPEAAILAVSAAKQVPVVKEGELTVGWRMAVTISVDHRVSDGAEAAQFMQALAFAVENPIRLLL